MTSLGDPNTRSKTHPDICTSLWVLLVTARAGGRHPPTRNVGVWGAKERCWGQTGAVCPQNWTSQYLSQEGDTALHDATRLSRYKIIKMLILHGADMMAKNQVNKGASTEAICCPIMLYNPSTSISLPVLAGWQDSNRSGAAVASGHTPGIGDQGAATRRDGDPCMKASGRH